MLYVLEQPGAPKAGLTMYKNETLFNVFIICAHIGVYVYYKHKQLIIKKCNADGPYIMDLKSILMFLNDGMIDDMNKGLVINNREGGGGVATKWENRGFETFCPPPSRQGKTFHAPPFKEWKCFRAPSPFNMAKTSSYCVKYTPKLVVPPPPSAWLILFLSPLFVGVRLHMPPPPPIL